MSSAPWPHSSSLFPFYGTFIRNKTRFGSEFSEFESAYTDSLLYKNVTKKINKLYSTGLIQDNFLQLNIQFENTQYNEQRDIPALPLEALGAQIGGVLSLWLGVTVMLLFEISEFVYHLLHECHSSRNRRGPPPREPTGVMKSTTPVVVGHKEQPAINNSK